jgi:hypothetical protein
LRRSSAINRIDNNGTIIKSTMVAVPNVGVTTISVSPGAPGIAAAPQHAARRVEHGGIAGIVPVTTALFLVATFSSIGLPGLNGFVGEFLILLGTFRVSTLECFLAATALFLGAMMTGVVVTPPLSDNVFHAGAKGYGWLNGGWGVGAFLSALYAPAAIKKLGSRGSIAISMAILTISMALSPYSPWLALAVLFYGLMGSARGLSGVAGTAWFAVYAPAKTPDATVRQLNAAINKALAAPDLRERFTKLGLEPTGGTPARRLRTPPRLLGCGAGGGAPRMDRSATPPTWARCCTDPPR